MISLPLWWFPTLAKATQAQRENVELVPAGIYWQDIDLDISIHFMLWGRKPEDAKEPVKA